MFKPRLQSPFRKPNASDTARLREFTISESSLCPWGPGRPSAIYVAFRRERVVYIGQSVDVVHRRKAHGPRPWTEVRYLPLSSPAVLHAVESAFIAFFQPADNGQHGAFFEEAPAAMLLRAFGFLPSQRPIRRSKVGSPKPYPSAVDMGVIWCHLDEQCRRLLVDLAKSGPRLAPKPHTVGALFKTIALKSVARAATRPPHVQGRRGRKRLIWIEKRLAPVILRLAENSPKPCPPGLLSRPKVLRPWQLEADAARNAKTA
jgi:hypothetical protein